MPETMGKSVHEICIVGTITTAGNSLRPLFSLETQKSAVTISASRLVQKNHEPSCELPCSVVRSSVESALQKSTDCVPSRPEKRA